MQNAKCMVAADRMGRKRLVVTCKGGAGTRGGVSNFGVIG